MSATTKVMRGGDRTIADCIIEGAREFEMATGRKAHRVHIGPEKGEAFQEMIEESLSSLCCPSKKWYVKHGHKHVAMFEGLEVYRQIKPGMVIE